MDEPLRAEETDTISELFGQVEKILVMDENGEVDDKFSFETVPIERVHEAIRILKDSEKQFAEAEQDTRLMYYGVLVELQLSAAHRTEEPEKADSLYAEALKSADKFPDADDRNEIKKIIRFMRTYGYEAYKIEFGDEWKTVDDALKIKDRERRNSALNSLSQRLIRQEPPDFNEALRAADAISDSHRWLCYSQIAVRQLQMKQADDAEKTLQSIDQRSHQRFDTTLLFVLIYDEQGNTEAAERYVDAAFAVIRNNKDDLGTVVNSYYRYTECLVQLKTASLAQHMTRNMAGLNDEFEQESQERLAKPSFSSLAELRSPATHPDRKKACSRSLAQASLYIGDREAAMKYLQDYRESVAADAERYRALQMSERVWLIGLLFEYGYQDDAKREIADIVAAIDAGAQVSTNGQSTKSAMLKRFSDDLTTQARFPEAVQIAKSITDEMERFMAYDRIENMIGLYSRSLDSWPTLNSGKRFTSPQDILDIAEMLTDEPGGKSLESYRVKVRRYADNLQKTE